MRKIFLPLFTLFLLLSLRLPTQPGDSPRLAQAGRGTILPVVGRSVTALSSRAREAGAAPTDTVIFEPIGQIGGTMSDGSVVEGNYVYIGTGPSLSILDISDPLKPEKIGYLLFPMGYTIDNIVKSGAYVFASTKDTLFVIDVSDVQHPFQAGAYPIPDYDVARSVTLAGNYVYLGCTGSLRVIDISDPVNPQLTGIYTNFWGVSDVEVVGPYAYLAMNYQTPGYYNGLAILDISNPISPTLVSTATPTFPASDLSIAGSYAYVTEADPGSGLHIFDISDPFHPVEASFYNYAEGITTSDIAIKDQVAYTIYGDNGLLMINISDPKNPAFLGIYYPLDGTATGLTNITILGNAGTNHLYAYLSLSNPAGLMIADITDPANPALVENFQLPGSTHNVTVVDQLAYVLDTTSFNVLDVSDPANPIQVSHFVKCEGDGRAEIYGSYAYVTCVQGGLQIIDISNPAQPVEIGYISTPGSATGVDVEWNASTNRLYAYVADINSGLRIIDVTDPISPTEVGFLNPVDEPLILPRDVEVSGKYAYLACSGEPGLRVVNVSDPAHPTRIGYLNYSNPLLGITVLGKYVYLTATNGYSLRILDISNPVYPQGVGNGTMPINLAYDVKVTGNAGSNHLYAFVAGAYGIGLFDVSNPSTPELIGSFQTFYYLPMIYIQTLGVDVQGNTVYAATMNGVYILRTLREKLATPILPSGGTLSPETSPIEITFPSGVFTQTAQVTYRHFLLDENTAGLVGINQTFELSAVISGTFQGGGTAGQNHRLYRAPTITAGQTFTMTLPYTDTQLGPVVESSLAFYYWDGNQWVRDPNSHLDMAQHMVSVNTDRFKKWAVLGETRKVFLPVVTDW